MTPMIDMVFLLLVFFMTVSTLAQALVVRDGAVVGAVLEERFSRGPARP